MAITQVYNLGSLNIKISPFNLVKGDLIRAVNVEKNQIGALDKRPGFNTYLGTTAGSAVKDLFFWEREDGSKFAYQNAGGLLYHSLEGTGAWTISGNGTVNNNRMGFGVLEDILVTCQSNGTTRHTTNGTSFTDTTLAPQGTAAGDQVFKAGRRIYINGTSSTTFFSSINDPTNWSTTGTSDSSSLIIPGAGKLANGFEANNRAVFGKSTGAMYTWDEFTLRRVPTNRGFTASNSIDEIEDFYIGLNPTGFYGYGGNRPELLSNFIEKQIYNNKNTGIAGSVFTDAPGQIYKNRYYCGVGNVTDDLTDKTVTNCVEVYDFQLNEWFNWGLAVPPTAWMVIKDSTGLEQLVFGDSTGQCYQFDGTALTDNGTAIEMVVEGMLSLDRPGQAKYFKKIRGHSNPGCQARFQVAITDSFSKESKQWNDLGDLVDGFAEMDFVNNREDIKGRRGNLLNYKIAEKSEASRTKFYGFEVEYDHIGRGGK